MQIVAPIELEFIFERDYFQYLTEHAAEYMAALVLLEHSHSDGAVMDVRTTPVLPAPLVPVPPEHHEAEKQPEPAAKGYGKKGAKSRGRGGSTGGRAKRRRTTTPAILEADAPYNVVSHVTGSQGFDSSDPTVSFVLFSSAQTLSGRFESLKHWSDICTGTPSARSGDWSIPAS